MNFGRRNEETLALVSCTIIFAVSILFPRHCTFARLETCRFQFQSILHEGDLIVSGNETRIIDYDYDLIGSIMVKHSATLIIRNVIFNQTGSDGRVGIIVENRASFVVTNTTLVISQNDISKITVKDEATLEVVDSNIINSELQVSVWVMDDSTAHIENSAISGLEESPLVIWGHSNLNVEDSTLGRVVVWGDTSGGPYIAIRNSTFTDNRSSLRTSGTSTVRVLDSTLGGVWAYGSPTIHIRRSTVGFLTIGERSEIWLIRTPTEAVWAGGNSKIWLIEASGGDIHVSENALVFVGWELPLFGPIAVHYRMAPFVRLAALIAVGAVGFLVLSVVVMKLRKRRASQTKALRKKED